jgi:hypothetical protein
MEPEGSLPCSQGSATGTSPESVQFLKKKVKVTILSEVPRHVKINITLRYTTVALTKMNLTQVGNVLDKKLLEVITISPVPVSFKTISSEGKMALRSYALNFKRGERHSVCL